MGKPPKPAVRSIPDHLLLQANLLDGGALSVEVAGGLPSKDVTFNLEVIGEAGVLKLEGGATRGFQSGELTLLLNGEKQTVDEGELTSLPEEAKNVAGVYAASREDISEGTVTAPDCEHAVRLTRLIEDVIASSETGIRKRRSNWPKP